MTLYWHISGLPTCVSGGIYDGLRLLLVRYVADIVGFRFGSSIECNTGFDWNRKKISGLVEVKIRSENRAHSAGNDCGCGFDSDSCSRLYPKKLRSRSLFLSACMYEMDILRAPA